MYLTPYTEAAAEHLAGSHFAAGEELGLLITPQSYRPNQYEVAEMSTWAADNGCFTLGDSFDLDAYLEWLASFTSAQRRRCLFATAPDVVADWDATLIRSAPALGRIRELGFGAALVLQDGATVETVPWDDLDAVFVGGTTEWKLGPDAAAIVHEAAHRDLWAHMGRVNSYRRYAIAAAMGCHSVDGTYVTFGPSINLPKIRSWIERITATYGEVADRRPADCPAPTRRVLEVAA